MRQEEIVALLRNPSSYPHPVDDVEVHETHGSWVFLAGHYAYKLKKALDLGFFDYSSPKKRRHYCEAEVKLNRRLAADVYLSVLSVRDQDGCLRLDAEGNGDGIEIDVVVQMKRLAPEVQLDHLLATGAAQTEHVHRLAVLLSNFYRNADKGPHIDPFGEPRLIRRNIEENFEQTSDLINHALSDSRYHAVRSAQLSFLTLQSELFARRISEGWIRDGHGDLRAEHVAFVPDPIVIDCIEFADRLRYGDTASDLAFLVMDLEFLGHRQFAEDLMKSYEATSGDHGVRQVVDFYASYRAFVRAKVDHFRLQQKGLQTAEEVVLTRHIKRHIELAHFHTLNFHTPLCILVGGLSGTGKSTVARSLGETLGTPVVRSDQVRKVLAGLPPTQHVPAAWEEGLYSKEFTRRTYTVLSAHADELLREGSSVIVDATFSTAEQRDQLLVVTHAAGAKLVHFECEAPTAVAKKRMLHRAASTSDPSDASPEIQVDQGRHYEPAPGAIRLATTDSPGEVTRCALDHLRLCSPPPERSQGLPAGQPR